MRQLLLTVLLAACGCVLGRATRPQSRQSRQLYTRTIAQSVLAQAPRGSRLIGAKGDLPHLISRLVENATLIRPNLIDSFSCRGRVYGYYADQDNDCQVFHICVPMNQLFPDLYDASDIFQFSFICPLHTIFSQDAMVCAWTSSAFPCSEAHLLYDYNHNFFVVPAEDVQRERSEPEVIESGPGESEVELESEVRGRSEVIEESEELNEVDIGASETVKIIEEPPSFVSPSAGPENQQEVTDELTEETPTYSTIQDDVTDIFTREATDAQDDVTDMTTQFEMTDYIKDDVTDIPTRDDIDEDMITVQDNIDQNMTMDQQDTTESSPYDNDLQTTDDLPTTEDLPTPEDLPTSEDLPTPEDLPDEGNDAAPEVTTLPLFKWRRTSRGRLVW